MKEIKSGSLLGSIMVIPLMMIRTNEFMERGQRFIDTRLIHHCEVEFQALVPILT